MSGSDVYDPGAHEFELPDLPDLDQLKEAAQVRREYYLAQLQAAEAEVAKADEILATLSGKKPAGKRRHRAPGEGDRKPVSADTLLSVVTALGKMSYGANKTIANAARCSSSTAGYALGEALDRGYVTREKCGRRYRYRITESGMDWITRPDESQPGLNATEPFRLLEKHA